ncbi:hypothetical protein AB4K20DRAFT_1998931 [Rhizopus microsporus]|uniref:SWIM-type domain-containing protein n=1 Tax=Rhizopus microsporus TaxID=58291 RepID=A0A1X0RJV5_RHIZD|nr:hypothetical protein BCV71DRAFT_282405 [Rhizopus microsporus]
MIESYHKQLKMLYLGRSRSLRVDRLVYLLSQVVALDCWQDTIKSAHGFGGFRLTANEEKKRRAAYCIDYDVDCTIVEQLEENVYQYRSFTKNILFYEMDTKEGFLKNCSCPGQTKICRHVLLVSRVINLSFSPHASALLLSKRFDIELKEICQRFFEFQQVFFESELSLEVHILCFQSQLTKYLKTPLTFLNNFGHLYEFRFLLLLKCLPPIFSAVTRLPESPWQPQPFQKGPSPPYSELPLPINFARSSATKPFPSQVAAARTFSSPSANQGFKYLYAPVQRRIPISQLRNRLRCLYINSIRALDIHYPDHHLVVLLIHNDYEPELRSQLNKFLITVRVEYDPLDSTNLLDPACTK